MDDRKQFTPAGQEVAGLSFGKMNTTIDIMEQRKVLDDDGFSSMEDVTVASVRAYREGRHGSERWANMAAFSEATDLFRFRVIPGLTITTAMTLVCGGERFQITSVEAAKGRGMYLEVMAKAVNSSSG